MPTTKQSLDATTTATSWIGPGGVVQSIATADAIAPELKALYAYWTALCGPRFAPARAEIAPRNIVGLLPWTHLHDVIDGGKSFRVRLVGASLSESVGANYTDRIVDDSSSDLLGRRLVSGMRRVIETRKPIRIVAARLAGENPSIKSTETLALPLSDDGETIDKILCCVILSAPKDLA